MMTNVGDDFSVRGKFSTVFLTGVVGFEGIHWEIRLGTCLFVLVMGGMV